MLTISQTFIAGIIGILIGAVILILILVIIDWEKLIDYHRK